jgi:hypothetical protein
VGSGVPDTDATGAVPGLLVTAGGIVLPGGCAVGEPEFVAGIDDVLLGTAELIASGLESVGIGCSLDAASLPLLHANPMVEQSPTKNSPRARMRRTVRSWIRSARAPAKRISIA